MNKKKRSSWFIIPPEQLDYTIPEFTARNKTYRKLVQQRFSHQLSIKFDQLITDAPYSLTINSCKDIISRLNLDDDMQLNLGQFLSKRLSPGFGGRRSPERTR